MRDLEWDQIGYPAEQTRVFSAGPDPFIHFPLRDEPKVAEVVPSLEPRPNAATGMSSWERLVEERRRYG